MRDQSKCCIYPVWGAAWHASNSQGRNCRAAEFPPALSLASPG